MGWVLCGSKHIDFAQAWENNRVSSQYLFLRKKGEKKSKSKHTTAMKKKEKAEELAKKANP